MRVDSRRSRSMARLRAVVVIQPPGFGGTPVDRPPLGGDRERLRDRVLGEVDVAEDADQGGGAAAGLAPEHDVELGAHQFTSSQPRWSSGSTWSVAWSMP